MAGPPPVPDRALLASRIQGFGNVNPPPLEEETGSTVAKKAVGRLGDMLGEEVMLTVEDFREKGAVGAVKDAVADAGDILIDGVAGLIGWFRGDPPEADEENNSTEEANRVLANGPMGAAYGISQASPTGGINAVWVMPEEADPETLAQLAAQSAPQAPAIPGWQHRQPDDPRIPKNIQPYQPSPASARSSPYQGHSALPGGGPVIAPYEPAPTGSSASAPSRPPAAAWSGNSYSHSPSPGSSTTSLSGPQALLQRVVDGDLLVGPDVARRLVQQCQATNVSGRYLGGMIHDRARRLYLGLDGLDSASSDAAMARLLGLICALASIPGSEVAAAAVQDVKKNSGEELSSLRSSSKHKVDAEAQLAALGFLDGDQAAAPAGKATGAATATAAAAAAAAPPPNLLDGWETGDIVEDGSKQTADEIDLLGDEQPAKPASKASIEADLLGDGPSSPVPTAPAAMSAPAKSDLLDF